MCGRYALVLRPRELRNRLRQYGLPVHDTDPDGPADTNTNEPSSQPQPQSPSEDDSEGTRQSYNIAPGYIEPVYRAAVASDGDRQHRYIVQGMKWGLIPSWMTKTPDYATQLKTINCRDDSLMRDTGMWTHMKKHKRCVVIAEGFFEWQKLGNDKIPHYIKRADGQLLFLAGLWDRTTTTSSTTSSDHTQKTDLYSYTIITTASSPQMSFLHDRMPAVLSTPAEILAWLDPHTTTWTKQLQGLLRPYEGTLEIYPVPKEVGKVGRSEERFVLPRDTRENITNWFVGGKKGVKRDVEEVRKVGEDVDTGKKQKTVQKKEEEHDPDTSPTSASPSPKHRKSTQTPAATPTKKQARHRSPTTNAAAAASPSKTRTRKSAQADGGKGNAKITSFFGK
ncbi:hypothetical protein BDZ91DRAFT_336373 [Kalaharituber pfeilii]|nr:hypothetical protein BDZ91DRAFT_336373 [Kalaharituber pfeilii]